MNSAQLAKLVTKRRRSFKYYLGSFVVVVLFAAIINPVLNKAEQRMGPRPINHFRASALACLMYASENDNHLPPSATWMDSVLPYAKNEFVFKDREIEDREEDEYGIAFFSPLSMVEVASVVNSEEVPLTFQSSLLHRNAASDLSTLPDPPRSRGVYNMAFLDGHVTALKPDEINTSVKIEFKP